MATSKVVTHDEWLAVRKKHLAKEKEFTRLRDQLSKERRDLPWELVEKGYLFEGENGRQTLADIFEGRSQLIVYHAMFDPATAGQHGMDGRRGVLRLFLLDGQLQRHHAPPEPSRHHDGGRLAGTVPEARRVQGTDGLEFPLVLLGGQRFNFDYRVSFTPEELDAGEVEYNYRRTGWSGSEAPGISVFLKADEEIYHTYSTYERGLDMVNVAYHYMDLVPRGRDEDEDGAGSWVDRRDEYPE